MTMTDPLADLRSQINTLDDNIIALLARRYALLPEVVKVKAAHGISHHVPERVKAVIDRNVAHGEQLGLPGQMVSEIYTAIINAAHRFEAKALNQQEIG